MARWTPRRGWQVAGSPGARLVVSLLVALVMVVSLGSVTASTAAKPRVPKTLFADAATVQVPTSGPYVRWRRVPQAWWLSDATTTASVGRTVKRYLTRAKAAKARPVIVLYAIPDRDCGEFSAGGFASGIAYRRWVAQIARALKGSSALVVVEPDALAAAGECGGASRLALLRWVSKKLARSGAWIYLDAGHSNWERPEVMVARLKAAGVRWARGVSLNVSNYRSTADERAFGASLLRGLRAGGIKGKRYVIDTSRNGAVPASSEWCNPVWARVGARPRLVRNRTPLDGLLWIKHPGESDGTCNGGPVAGGWSNLLAARLTAPAQSRL